MAHASFSQNIFINAAPAAAIARLSEYSQHTELHPMIVAVRLLDTMSTADGGIRRDYRITDRMRLGPFTTRFTYRASITAAPNGRLDGEAFQFPRIHLHVTTICQPEGDGTRVAEEVKIDAPRLLMRTVYTQAQAAHKQLLANLKTLLESAPATPHARERT
ncbi:MAG: hypothetical protein OJF49_003523 [Ktedonobacterales bacterium]|jgi:hypothetical protein|nr:MAG: hypothetical protein OJF49_003523 [Ktedonobacterales bacterium]